MSRAVVKLPRAEADLIGCYAYLSEQASEAMADRFFAAVEKTLELVVRSSGIGAPRETNNPRLTGLHREFEDRIELVRVLHGARDISTILDAEGEDEDEE